MNIVIKNSAWTEDDLFTLFEDEEIHIVDEDELSSLMVTLGIYPSKSKARQVGRHGPIPKGWTEYKASKKRKLWIWNPTEG